ncbi:HET-domain-containing protein [Apiospora kogelbergensis]|uniref:HET-domain-containing protein n=1 Tax=Apiospora kogelbergensis TaxID=1337665 RepID=UPI003130BC63
MDCWQPLDTSDLEIRLLDLASSQSTPNGISCMLRKASLKKHLEYEALSYVWRTPISTEPKTILLHGVPHPVTDNLHAALEGLRYHERPRTLWVDAVCIDQNNNEERGSQVAMMDKVYSYASKVVVWLGDSSTSDIANEVKYYGNDLKRHYKRYPRTFFMLHGQADRWWSRVWTFQEAVLAKELVFHCGTATFTLQDLVNFSESVSRHFLLGRQCCFFPPMCQHLSKGLANVAIKNLHQFVDDCRTLHKGSKQLVDIVLDNSNRNSTNPRDRVYGFLGLADNIPNGFVQYNLPLEEFVVHVTLQMIREKHSLEPIRHVAYNKTKPPILYRFQNREGIEDNLARLRGLPTWCPDWTMNFEPRVLNIRKSRRSYTYQRFSAAGLTKAQISSPKAKLLSVRGILYDTVVQVGKRSPENILPVIPSAILQQWCDLVADVDAAHYNIHCDGCGYRIYGVRQKCTNCEDYDLCSKCFSAVDKIHEGHAFREIRGRRSTAESGNATPSEEHDNNRWFCDPVSAPKHSETPGIPCPSKESNRGGETTRTTRGRVDEDDEYYGAYKYEEEEEEEEGKGSLSRKLAGQYVISGGHRIWTQTSSWEVLNTFMYPFTNDTLQTAFRKTLTADSCRLQEVHNTAPIFDEVAFATFWCYQVESRNVVSTSHRKGYSKDTIQHSLDTISEQQLRLVEDLVCTVLWGQRFFVTERGT